MDKSDNSPLTSETSPPAELCISDDEDLDIEQLPYMFIADNGKNLKRKQPRKTQLDVLLKNMINENTLPNLLIAVGSRIFRCHTIVLQCYSQFFSQCTNEILIHLPEKKVTQEAFAKIYRWMLCDSPIVMPQGIIQLFVAARFLQIDHLIRQCWYCFNDSDCFPEDAAFMMYLEANRAGQRDLEQILLARVCKFFLTAVASRDFLDLTKTQVCSLLRSSTIGVHSEIEVLLAAVRWLTHDWEKREQFVEDITKCVRFNLIPSWYLVALTIDDLSSPEVLQVIKHPEVKKLISDGLSVCNSQIFYKNRQKELQEFVKRMKLPTHPERVLICDTLCEYHSCINKVNVGSTTYEAFKKYLGKIRSLGKEHWPMVQMANRP